MVFKKSKNSKVNYKERKGYKVGQNEFYEQTYFEFQGIVSLSTHIFNVDMWWDSMVKFFGKQHVCVNRFFCTNIYYN